MKSKVVFGNHKWLAVAILTTWINEILLWPQRAPYSDQRVHPSVRPSVHPSVRPSVTDSFCWRVVVCIRFSTDYSNDDTNQLREQCRCATCIHFILTLTLPWLQVKVTNYFDFVNLDVWRVVVCVRFSSETTRPITPMMIPINWGNNVDVQHTLHFDLNPSMTAG